MNRQKLKREAKAWVEEGIISHEQYDKIIERYSKSGPNSIILLFAILLMALGFLTFIMSDWAREPHLSRIVILASVTTVLYVLGDIRYRKSADLIAISFIVLGYIAFGAGMLLAIDIYNIQVTFAWPFIIWAVVGLGVYFIYEHKLLFSVAIAVTTIGQLYNASINSAFSWVLLFLLLLGFGHFVYHHRNYLFSYLFSISFVVQLLTLVFAASQQYYWLILYFLILYVAGDLIREQVYRKPFKIISLLAIFIFGMYQTFILQDEFYMDDLTLQWSFIIVWFVLFGAAIAIKIIDNRSYQLIDFVLFLPIAFIPFSYGMSLIVLFIFSLVWLFIGYKQDNSEYILIGTISFLVSVFTVYIQFAWDAMNKSLFFLIGGILLFLISFLIEKQRRTIVDKQKGGE